MVIVIVTVLLNVGKLTNPGTLRLFQL